MTLVRGACCAPLTVQAFKPLAELLTPAGDASETAEEKPDADTVRHLLRWLRGAQLQVRPRVPACHMGFLGCLLHMCASHKCNELQNSTVC